MYPPIKAIYENGNVILQETPPTLQKTNVIIMFINDDIAKTSPHNSFDPLIPPIIA